MILFAPPKRDIKKWFEIFLQQVMDKGDIYEAEYEGLYSVSEERFITEKEAESGEFRDIKQLKEKNYFFQNEANTSKHLLIT